MLVHDARARTAACGPTTAARPRPPPRRPIASSQPTASRSAFIDAVRRGTSVGVPGTLRGARARASQRTAGCQWAALVRARDRARREAASRSRRACTRCSMAIERLVRDPLARAYFFDADGQAAGRWARCCATPRTPPTLRAIAAERRARRSIAARSRATSSRRGAAITRSAPGDLTLADLAAYRAKEREPVCGRTAPIASAACRRRRSRRHRRCCRSWACSSAYDVDAMGARSGAGACISSARPGGSPTPIATVTSPTRTSSTCPSPGCSTPSYLARARRGSIQRGQVARACAGRPTRRRERQRAVADGAELDLASTSHFSIVDRRGQCGGDDHDASRSVRQPPMIGAASCSTTSSPTFRSCRRRTASPSPTASRPASGRARRWRRRSSTTRTGGSCMIVGSPGGSAIINYVAQDVSSPCSTGDARSAGGARRCRNFGSRNGPTELEAGTPVERLRATARGAGPSGARRRARERRARHPARRRRVGRRGRSAPRRRGAGRVNSERRVTEDTEKAQRTQRTSKKTQCEWGGVRLSATALRSPFSVSSVFAL